MELYYNIRNVHRNKCHSRGRVRVTLARRLGSAATIRNRGVMGLLVRQCRRNSTLGVEHS